MKFASQRTVKQKPSVYLAYNSSETPPDEELIKQIAKGDVEAFKRLFARYWNELYQITYRRVLSKTVAKAILVDVFEIVWKNSKSLPGNLSVRDYLYSTLKCQIFLHYEQHPPVLKKFIAISGKVDWLK